jgi:hypothetical protein
MNFTLWRDPRGHWAVCDGPGPTEVSGYILGEAGGWKIEDDEQNRVFLDYVSAAAAVLERELPGGVSFYELARGEDVWIVATTEPMKDLLLNDGWTLKARLRST